MEKHFDGFVYRANWGSVNELIATRQPKGYGAAVRNLAGLRDLAARAGTTAEFSRRIGALREAQVRKQAFVFRLDQAGL